METCKFKVFQMVLEPWLHQNYIRKVLLNGQDQLLLFFTDGGQQDYRVDDCSRKQLLGVIDDLRRRGIVVEQTEPAAPAICTA